MGSSFEDLQAGKCTHPFHRYDGNCYREKLLKRVRGGSQPSHKNAKKPHPHLSVPDEIWGKVDDLTFLDRKLYYLAMRCFACGVKAYEQQANHSLEHLLPAGGWEYLYDVSDAFVKIWHFKKYDS